MRAPALAPGARLTALTIGHVRCPPTQVRPVGLPARSSNAFESRPAAVPALPAHRLGATHDNSGCRRYNPAMEISLISGAPDREDTQTPENGLLEAQQRL